MNPHFIFNVLNSIKAYIYQNDKKAAAEYLSKFAQLMRKVLDASNAPVIKLADELEALELYIQLETMQLEPTFEYHITTGTSTDTHSINIPSLIIQPFVENAIKHGLQHKQGHKQLFITTETLPGNQLLKITVQDNGIGRAASSKINSQRINHTPFATIASAQRLNLLNNNSTQKVSVTFTDLYDNQGNSTGTIAQLTISI
jgi:LytS/YehU family sensor histidine kinase